MPTKQEIRNALCDALVEIQHAGGRATSNLSGGTRPLSDLEGFDSLNSVEAVFQVSAVLNCEITQDVALFASHGQTQTIDQIVDAIHQLIEPQ